MTRSISRFALTATLVALFAVPASAQDVSGDWAFSFQTPQGTQTIDVTLAQEGSDVSGTASLDQMGEIAVSGGTMEESKLTFALNLDFQGQTFTLAFSGTVEGDSMEGQLTTPDGNAAPFTAARKEG